MEDDPAFDSDEATFDPPEEVSHLGMKLAQRTLDNVIEDRRASKQAVKLNMGVKLTNEEYAHWWNRWTVYRRDALKDQ
jgi:hypothetical protein